MYLVEQLLRLQSAREFFGNVEKIFVTQETEPPKGIGCLRVPRLLGLRDVGFGWHAEIVEGNLDLAVAKARAGPQGSCASCPASYGSLMRLAIYRESHNTIRR